MSEAALFKLAEDCENLRHRLPCAGDFVVEYSGDQALENIKAIVPALKDGHRRHFSVLIKLLEIEEMIGVYRDALESVTSANDTLGYLKIIRSFADEKTGETLDQYVRAVELRDAFAAPRK